MQSLAIKYRPTTFNDVCSQASITAILENQILSRTFKQAYIFTGPAGCGKTTCARILANEINNGHGNPIELDAASNNSVDNIREITAQAKTKSLDSEYKVYILDEVHMLSAGAWAAMLKLIEEPPTQTLFILVCREPENLLETIRSRVQRFDVKPIALEDIQQALIQKRGLEQQDAERVARLCNGNWLTALEELNAANENQTFFQSFVDLMRRAYLKDVKDLKRWSENSSAMGREEQKRMLTYFLRMTREAFMYNFRQPELNYMTDNEEQFCKKFARFVNEGNVLGFQELYQTAIRDIGQNANAKMVFFDITMKVAVLLHTT